VNPGECRGWAELLSSVVRLSRHVLTGIYLCWQADVNLECYTPTWAAYATYTIVMLALYTLGLPMFLFVYLYRHRKTLEVRSCSRWGKWGTRNACTRLRCDGWREGWLAFSCDSFRKQRHALGSCTPSTTRAPTSGRWKNCVR